MFRLFLILLLLCSPVYAAKKKTPHPAPEANEECIKPDAVEEALSKRISISNRKDFGGDELETLRAKMKASEEVPNLPDTTDQVKLYRSGGNYIIVLFHKECLQISSRISATVLDKILNEDGSI